MINSDTAAGDAESARAEDKAVTAILGTGAKGGLVLAALATACVVALWFAFYALVFVPRASAS